MWMGSLGPISMQPIRSVHCAFAGVAVAAGGGTGVLVGAAGGAGGRVAVGCAAGAVVGAGGGVVGVADGPHATSTNVKITVRSYLKNGRLGLKSDLGASEWN
jgi:hypothetical protein